MVKKKIIVLLRQLHSHGGLEKVVCSRFSYLAAKDDLDIKFVLTEQRGFDVIYPLLERIKIIDLNLRYNRYNTLLSPKNLLTGISHLVRLKRILVKEKPDIIFCMSHDIDKWLLPIIELKTKLVFEHHSSRYGEKPVLNNRLRRFLLRVKYWIEKRYDLCVLLNEEESKFYSSRNLEVIPNFIELRTEVSFLHRKPYVIFAGRLARVKQIGHIIEAWSKIQSEIRTGWELRIYGDGEEQIKGNLLELINSQEIPNIRFMGSSINIYDVFEESSITVLSSKTECFPMALLESLSCGTPVVSYDCPTGPRHIISHKENGLLVKADDIESLAYSLTTLMADKERRKTMSEAAYYSSREFSKDKIMECWIKVIRQL